MLSLEIGYMRDYFIQSVNAYIGMAEFHLNINRLRIELEEMNLLWNCLVEQMKSDIRKANPDWFKHENHEQGT